MNKYIIVILVCSLLFSSCKSNLDNEDIFVIKVDNIDKSEFDWLSLIDVKRIVPLELTDNSLLGLAQKCLVKNDRVLFLDSKMKIVYVFDLKGRFLFSIDSQGGGDKEYMELVDVNFNYDSTQIVILDRKSLLFYDANDGHFLKKMNLNLSASHSFYKFVNIAEDLYYFFSTVGDYTIYRYSKGQFDGIRERKSYQLVVEHFHCQNSESCLLSPDYGFYNIDEITKSGVKGKYYIDFGDKVIPEAMLPRDSRQFEKVDRGNYYKSIVGVKENDFGIYIQSVGPDYSYCEIYLNKRTGELISGVPDAKTGLVITDVTPSSFYALVYPDYFTENSGFYGLLKDYLQEEGNPVLLELSEKGKMKVMTADQNQ